MHIYVEEYLGDENTVAKQVDQGPAARETSLYYKRRSN
jgi:hypothetical protein